MRPRKLPLGGVNILFVKDKWNGKMSPKINGHCVPVSLQLVSAVETDIFGKPSDATTSYRHLRHWLVADEQIKGEFRRRTRRRGSPEAAELPKFSNLPWWRLLSGRVLGGRWEHAIRAQAVLFESNLRTFYVGRPEFTLKICGPSRSVENFQSEILIRSDVASSRTVNVPRVTHFDLNAARPYLCEDLIKGRTLRDARAFHLVLEELLPSLFRMYEHFGIKHKPLQDFFDLESISAELEQIVLPSGWVKEEISRKYLLESLQVFREVANSPIPTSIGHGDLTLQNMALSSDGKVFLLDWEYSAQVPLAWDFRKLVWQVPGAQERLTEKMKEYEGRAQIKESPPVTWQLALASIKRLTDSLEVYGKTLSCPTINVGRHLHKRVKREFAIAKSAFEIASMFTLTEGSFWRIPRPHGPYGSAGCKKESSST